MARAAIVAAVSSHGALALGDVVQRTGVAPDKARQVLSNCVRSGQLTYTLERRAHAKRPVAVYEPAQVLEELAGDAGWVDLANIWR